jgi:hypothetical protein
MRWWTSHEWLILETCSLIQAISYTGYWSCLCCPRRQYTGLFTYAVYTILTLTWIFTCLVFSNLDPLYWQTTVFSYRNLTLYVRFSYIFSSLFFLYIWFMHCNTWEINIVSFLFGFLEESLEKEGLEYPFCFTDIVIRYLTCLLKYIWSLAS